VPDSLLADPHLHTAVDLLRMGMSTSAEAEIAAVAWPAGDAAKVLRARLYDAVGRYAKAMVAMAHVDLRGYATEGSGAGVWRLSYPAPAAYVEHVKRAAKASDVDPHFVWSIMRTESRFERAVQSPVLATGLLQLMLPTARAMNKRLEVKGQVDYADLKRPEINIPLGVGYMGRLRQRWGGRDALVASSYNAGPGNTRKWLRARPTWPLDAFVEAVPFRENRRYIKSVLTSLLRYHLLAGGKHPKLDLTLPAAGGEEADD
jgi:soluble lytic murein transglycosylase